MLSRHQSCRWVAAWVIVATLGCGGAGDPATASSAAPSHDSSTLDDETAYADGCEASAPSDSSIYKDDASRFDSAPADASNDAADSGPPSETGTDEAGHAPEGGDCCQQLYVSRAACLAAGYHEVSDSGDGHVLAGNCPDGQTLHAFIIAEEPSAGSICCR